MRLHPYDAMFCEVFYRSKGSGKVLEHVEQCPKCQARLHRRASADRFRQADYGSAFEHSYQILEQRQAALIRERGEAPQLLARLIGLIPERQQLLLCNSRRFQKWGLWELLIEMGREETFIDPVHAEVLFRLALEISAHLDSSIYGRERTEDIRARTWTLIGNALRASADLPASEEAFEEAFLRLQKGTGDTLERALTCEPKAILLRFQGRFDESLRLSRRAIAIFRQAKDDHMVGRALVGLSITQGDLGEHGKAIAVLCQALDLIDPPREPRTVLSALHCLMDHLTSAGRFMEAQRVFRRAGSIYQRFPEPRSQSRRMWVEAKIKWGLGQAQEAVALMTRARDGFVAANANRESDLVSQDLVSMGVADS
jgi:tetratricopeptide (TPR) repeat protein